MIDPRTEWIRELERRQDNIDPIRRIPNGAIFHGALINGNLRLNGVQRIGAMFLGICNLTLGMYFLVEALVELGSWKLPDIVFLLFSPLSLWFGWRITKNAIVNDPSKARRR